MAPAYEVLKAKWKKRQDTETVVFGATRDGVVTKLKQLVQTKVAALKGGLFTDEEWDISKYPLATLYQNNRSPTQDPTSPYRYNKIQRLSVIDPQSKFYVNGTTPGDVAQGGLGDCWFLAVLAAAADVPGLVQSIAVEVNEQAKIYGFVFYKSGWAATIVDDYMFFHSNSNLVFSQAEQNETWAPLLEKAFAKISGDYESIDGAPNSQRALVSLGGIKYKDYQLAQVKKDSAKKNELWNALLATKNPRDTIFACGRDEHHPVRPNGHGEDIMGLVSSHVYSFLRAVNFHGNQLIEIRNPWAETEWNGPWSDTSNEWAPYKKDKTIPELKYSLANDGSFFMPFDSFLNEFDEVESCEYPLAAAKHFNRTATISTESLVTSWWYGDYDIYYTDRVNQSNLSGVKLSFESTSPDGPLNVVGEGSDNIGPYSIQGTYDNISKAIAFTKQYINVNANTAWRYQGIYNGDLFSGTWGTEGKPNMGNFLIKQACTIKRQSDEGSWQGYYFDVDNKGVLMLIYITAWKDPSGVEFLHGSGTDVVGTFTIDGQVAVDNSVSLTKRYEGNTLKYSGWKSGNAIFGTWGAGVHSDGDFVIWKY